MGNKELQLYLTLLDEYLNHNNRVYDYRIQTISSFDGGVCFTIIELNPCCPPDKPAILIFKIMEDNRLSILNSNLGDCIYDYLEENEATKEEADMEADSYKRMIEQFKKNGSLE